MKINIEMYEDSLLEALRLMEDDLQKLGRLKSAIRVCWQETGQAAEISAIYRRQLLAFGEASDRLQAAIIARGVEIGKEKIGLRLMRNRVNA